MAQLAPRVIRARIDDDLAYLVSEWSSLPDVVAEWDDWTEHERLDFVLEWPLREERLRELRRRDAEGLLSPGQRARYGELLDLIRRHRTELERLLAD
ncbi:MAG: hypothetical protein M3Q10_02030 [Chloroflexota bacterium]|nr:hypothetical protein [Chloroflexota bacterium]